MGSTPSPERERQFSPSLVSQLRTDAEKLQAGIVPKLDAVKITPQTGWPYNEAADAIEALTDRLSRVEGALEEAEVMALRLASRLNAIKNVAPIEARQAADLQASLRKALLPHPEDTGCCETCGSDDPATYRAPFIDGRAAFPRCDDPFHFHGQAGS